MSLPNWLLEEPDGGPEFPCTSRPVISRERLKELEHILPAGSHPAKSHLHAGAHGSAVRPGPATHHGSRA